MRCGHCGRDDATLYPSGAWCVEHSPAAIAGRVVPVPDPALTMAGLMAARQPATSSVAYGPAPRAAWACTREDRETAHLVPGIGELALCGRPAGLARARWVRCETTPDVKHRCKECDRAMNASNPKPYNRRYWWRT